MIAVDTNLLIYAHREDTAFHKQAKRALKQLAESGRRLPLLLRQTFNVSLASVHQSLIHGRTHFFAKGIRRITTNYPIYQFKIMQDLSPIRQSTP